MNGGDGVGGGTRRYAAYGAEARGTLGVEVKPARTEEATVHRHSEKFDFDFGISKKVVSK